MSRHVLVCAGILFSVLGAACAGASQQGAEQGDAADGQDREPAETTPPAAEGQLPSPVAQSVLGDHLDNWFVWLEMPWADPFLPRCDQLAGSEEPCERARMIAESAQAGELVVLGPEEMEEESLGLLAQGLSQMVAVFPDEETAEQMTQTLREVLAGWGAEGQDLSFADTAWAADHFDTAPGGFAESDPDLATRMVAVRQGRTLVVLSHADYPQNPRLDTQPIARDIAGRLADAE
ncbi:MAG: hypothetical protein ACR2HR_13350 [Euzebya sp.]